MSTIEDEAKASPDAGEAVPTKVAGLDRAAGIASLISRLAPIRIRTVLTWKRFGAK